MKRLHEGAIRDDPFISASLGPKAKIERMRAAALRLGGQGLKTSFDDHLLIIGDAAGHIDPLTGEGIHTAMLVQTARSLAIDGLEVSLLLLRDGCLAALHFLRITISRLAKDWFTGMLVLHADLVPDFTRGQDCIL